MKIKFKKLNKLAVTPTKSHNVDAGFDLTTIDIRKLTTDSITALSTGIAVDIPKGYYGKIESRSGFALDNQLVIKGGVIDAQYHGEIKIIVLNTGMYPITIANKRIAQLIIHKLPIISLEEVADFNETSERNEKGFGSSD